MECPHCHGHEFQMTVVLTGRVRCRFEGGRLRVLGNPVLFRSEWNPDSDCRCLRCRWEGKVEEVWDDSPMHRLIPTH